MESLINLKIVIIDNDKAFANTLSTMLEPVAERIMCFSDSELALGFIMKNETDILIMDIDMPKINGNVLCDILRSTPQLEDLPVVLVSGTKDMGDFSLYFKGVDFMQKPLDTNVLLNKIKLYHVLKTAKDTADRIMARLTK